MIVRSSTTNATRLGQLAIARGTIDSIDDSPKMQTANVRLMQDEAPQGMEVMRQYGMHSVPLQAGNASPGEAPSSSGSGSSSGSSAGSGGSGSGSSGQQQQQQAAEVVVAFVHGSRSHGIVIAHDDRRYQPTNWKPGESGFYHYTQATAKFTDGGFVHDAGDKKQPAMWTVGASTVTFSDSSITLKNNNTTVVVEKDDVTVTVGNCVFKVTSNQILCGSASASIPVMLSNGAPSQRLFTDK